MNIVKNFENFFGVNSSLREVKRLLSRRNYSHYQNQILVEAWLGPPICLGLTSFLPTLVEKYQAKPISYYGCEGGKAKSLKEKLRNRFSYYHFIGIRNFIHFDFSKKKRSYLTMAETLIKSHNTPDSFEKITYRDILIGDAVGDSFLRGANLPTVDFNHPGLIYHLSNSLYYIDLLYNYFERNEVKAVIILESTYILALPGRVAIHLGIDVFVISDANVFRLSKERYIAYHQFQHFKEIFNSLPKDVKSWGISQAKKQLSSRLSKAGFETTRQISFNHFPKGQKYTLSKPLKLLVAAHDFFDSPHRVGQAFFPDFFQWLNFVKDVSLKNNYHLVIRANPSARRWNSEVLQSIFQNVPNVEFINPRVANRELTSMKFSAVLTVFGTVGSEWPLFGIPVINASPGHPHVFIPGNITPNSKEHYMEIMQNLNSQVFEEQNSSNSWAEYVFMKDFFMQKSFNTKHFTAAAESLNLDVAWIRRRGYDWNLALEILKREQYDLDLIRKGFLSFLDSNDYFLHRGHLGMANKIEYYNQFK